MVKNWLGWKLKILWIFELFVAIWTPPKIRLTFHSTCSTEKRLGVELVELCTKNHWILGFFGWIRNNGFSIDATFSKWIFLTSFDIFWQVLTILNHIPMNGTIFEKDFLTFSDNFWQYLLFSRIPDVIFGLFYTTFPWMGRF